MKLERRAAMATLLADRADELLVVPGLGSTTWDLVAAGDNDRNFYLWGAMGGAAMIGLGLALAQPAHQRPHVAAQLHVDPGRGLVEEENLRFM